MSHHQETPAHAVEIDAWHESHGVAPMQEHGSHVNIRFMLIFFVTRQYRFMAFLPLGAAYPMAVAVEKDTTEIALQP